MTTHTSTPTSVTPSKRDPIADWLDVFIRMLSVSKTDSVAVRDELEDHLRSRVDDLIITGSSEHDAVLQAVSELGETADLAKRFKQANHPSRRRHLMSTALIAIAGSALTLGAFTVINPPASITPAAGFAGGSTAIALQPGEAAPFDETLKQYDISVFYAEDLYGLWGEMQAEHRTERVVETIWQLVTPELWEANGGNEASVLITGSTMFIRGPEESHAGAEWVLETLVNDLEAEHRAYLEAEAREEVEDRAREDERRAYHEREMIEKEHRNRRTQVEAAEFRAQQIEELRVQYEQLKIEFIDVTRMRAVLDFQQSGLESEWFAAEPGQKEEFTIILADAVARKAELDLRYNDISIRVDRIGSLLINLELAEFSSPSPFKVSTWLPADKSSSARLPEANPLSLRLPPGTVAETLPEGR